MRFALFDYGAGNLHSLHKAFESAGVSVAITDDWNEALALDALVLPGVGAFGPAARALGSERYRVRAALDGGLPCLGICLGMQLLLDGSDEAGGAGIGRIGGRVTKLDHPVVPHMGWNDVQTTDDPLFRGVDGLVTYYANSYVCEPTHEEHVIGVTSYGGATFAAAVRSGPTWGVQFHPEKSSAAGLRIVRNFVEEVHRIREESPS